MMKSGNIFMRVEERKKTSRPVLFNRLARFIKRAAKKTFGVVIVVLVCWGLWEAVKKDEIFSVKSIEVTGCVRTDTSLVVSQLSSVRGKNMFGLNMDQVNRIVSLNPWVKESVSARKLPDTLSINVTEFSPAAIANLSGRYFLVANSGDIVDLHNPAAVSEGLPIMNLSTEKDSNTARVKIATAAKLLQRIKDNYPKVFSVISEVLVSNEHEIGFFLMGDRNLLILNPDDSGSGLIKYLGIVHEIRKRNSAARVIDLRFDGQVIVCKETPAEVRL